METTNQRPGSRAQRARMPRTTDLIRDVAIENRVCISPIPMEATAPDGQTKIIDLPCGATRASKCPACAEKAKLLRMAQCREGWHLESEPVFEPDPTGKDQRTLGEQRSDLVAAIESANADGRHTEVEELRVQLFALDQEIAAKGIRGNFPEAEAKRRVRSTRRRSDVVDLPKRKIAKTTVGRAFTSPDGQVFRPSLFVTVTLDSYGRVLADGSPINPADYDYKRAAKDAIHFSKAIDRLVQNLRRVAGFQVQYFGAVEPQRRLAMHFHMAIRGTIPRAEIKQVIDATYHQVWWPSTEHVEYPNDRLPVWADALATFVDPETGCVLPTWDEALDDVGDDPMHVVRFGGQADIQGLLAGSPDANRRIGYITKYLMKSVDECHSAESQRQTHHIDRLVEALRYEPCSPTCANWLRYGIQPKNPKSSHRPGYCRGKAHRRESLGYGGRRVLVSDKWSGKNLRDHKEDRRRWVMETLGIDEPEQVEKVSWNRVESTSHIPPLGYRLMLAIAERKRWRAELDRATQRASGLAPPNVSAVPPPSTKAA